LEEKTKKNIPRRVDLGRYKIVYLGRYKIVYLGRYKISYGRWLSERHFRTLQSSILSNVIMGREELPGLNKLKEKRGPKPKRNGRRIYECLKKVHGGRKE
jgi:hypothetical protein